MHTTRPHHELLRTCAPSHTDSSYNLPTKTTATTTNNHHNNNENTNPEKNTIESMRREIEELRVMNERLKMALDEVKQAVSICDSEGNTIFVNR